MRRAPATLAALVLVLAGAACGRDAKVDTGASTTLPGRGEDVVLTIATGGGFVPFGADFANVPLKVQRDGRAYTGGVVPAIYPGPATTPVMTGKISGARLQQLLADAKAAGLAEDHLDAGQPGVTDMPSTSITVEIDGTAHAQSIYALAYGTDDGGGGMSGLTAEQVAVRRKVSAFVTEASSLVSQAADQPLVPTAYQVLASKVPDDGPAPEIAPNHLTWPAPDVPLVEGACVDVDAAHAAALTEALTKATQITVWHDGGGSWHLAVRARLPGDAACAAAAG